MRTRLSAPSRVAVTSMAACWLFFTLTGHAAPPLADAPAEANSTLSYKRDIDFDNFELDKLPPGFAPVLSGVGSETTWRVTLEPSAPSGTKVLAQTSGEQVAFRFPIVLYDKLLARNVDVAVRFKTLSGKVDQAAGVVLRFRDVNHFYVVRADAFQNQIHLYKVINGERQDIVGGATPVQVDTWHTLRIVAQETHFTVFFDNQKLWEAEDAALPEAGRVGLSTQADSVTVFDDLHIESYDAAT